MIRFTGVYMLKVIGLDNESLWQETVKGFKNHDVFYLPQYTEPFRLHGDGEPLLFYYEADGLRAANVVMKRDIALAPPFTERIPKGTYFDLSTPYGYGGFMLEGTADEGAIRRMSRMYEDCCRDMGIVSEFVRFHPLLNNHVGLEPLYQIIQMGKTITLDLSSSEIIYANIRKRTRNRIRKAQQYGLSVEMGCSSELFAQFADLYIETMARTGALPYYFFSPAFFERVRVGLPDNAMIFYAVCGGEIAAMELVLHCNGQMHSHLQASRRESQHLSPIPLMVYTEALWGFEHGYRHFHMGGGLGSSEDDDIFQFKNNFNRSSTTRFHTGRRIFSQEKYDTLLHIRAQESSEEPRPGFFPGYRA